MSYGPTSYFALADDQLEVRFSDQKSHFHRRPSRLPDRIQYGSKLLPQERPVSTSPNFDQGLLGSYLFDFQGYTNGTQER
mmetsp:Transcript_42798/g.167236  ORF Transcript_42798/g.167236 Transcript_42798/m.167236 type:complete len:80 (+) Transcript_42798:1275-1514(+)